MVVVNVHLKCAGIGGANSGQSSNADRTRKEVMHLDLLVQALEDSVLRPTAASTSTRPPSAIILGDFNLDPNEPGFFAFYFRFQLVLLPRLFDLLEYSSQLCLGICLMREARTPSGLKGFRKDLINFLETRISCENFVNIWKSILEGLIS